MNVFENENIRRNLRQSFPSGFVNLNFEFIAHPGRNSYFLLNGVNSEIELSAKVLEWLSREAVKGGSKQTQKYHHDGINRFLGTEFSREEMEEIYSCLGNAVNHAKTIRFIESGYYMKTLKDL